MRVLISGASGFIGSHLAHRLREQHEVIALVRRRPALPSDGLQYIEQDLRQALDLARLPSRLDVIVHLAAILFPHRCADDAEPFLVNVVATWRLLEFAQRAGVQTFVHGSTGGVYGLALRPFTEEDPLHPMDLYSLTKAQAELAVQAAPGEFRKIVLRYFYPYAAGTPNIIPETVRRAVMGEPIQICASHKPAINPLHISDAIEATVRSLTLDHDEVLNIAGTEVITFAGIAELAGRFAGRAPLFELRPLDPGDLLSRANILGDIQRMTNRLSFVPRVTLEEGIAELVDQTRRESSG